MGKIYELGSSNLDLVDDGFVRGFAEGAAVAGFVPELNGSVIIRGVGGGSQKQYKRCWQSGQTFYAIDTGYFGNIKHKTWHRITCNALQNMDEFIERPVKRLETILQSKWKFIYKQFTPGRKILICPPSDKIMNLFGQGSANEWTTNVINNLRKITDRPIEVRLKPSRFDRVTTKTIQQALADDVHCLITYNSIAATESLMCGKPAISLGPNAASKICETELKNVDNPKVPTKDEMYAFLTHLSYAQFTQPEMADGYAWRILQGDIK
jgi:hypothetical protein